MHELSICQSLISAIEKEAERQHFSQVKEVRLEIGRFAGVEAEALRFSFDVARRGTVCAAAELVIIDLPGLAVCYDCGEAVEMADRLSPCPKCGGGRLHVTGGTELKIKDLEVL